MSKLGVFLNPVHGRPTDIDFIRRLQPASVKIINPDVQKVADVYAAAPNALIVLRYHPRSEEHDQAYANPIGTGASHADADAQMWAEMLQQAQQRGLALPNNVIFCGLNEPHVWTNLDQAIQYYVSYLDTLKSHSLRGLALSLSVGWPANTGPDTPVNWAPYAPVLDAIKRGNHMLGLHEYWSHDGPKTNWRWWAGRYTQCPWDVPILIGECGIDAAVADGNTDYLKRGWRAKLTDQQYVAQLAAYDAELMKDERIHSAEVFTTDGGREWITSMDTEPAHSAWLDYATRTPTPAPATAAPLFALGDVIRALYTINGRSTPGLTGTVVGQMTPGQMAKVMGGPQSVSGLTWWQTQSAWVAQTAVDGTPLFEVVKPQSDWEKAIGFVLRWEGGYANNPNDPGGETNYGISKRSYPDLDIRNLTRDQAIAIYERDYWHRSGAANLPWPMSLVHFDSAVNSGVAQANKWLAAANGSATAYAGMRLEFYTQLSTWLVFGLAWVRRVSDLLGMI